MTRVVVIDLDDRDALQELADILRPLLIADAPADDDGLVSTAAAADARGLHPKTVERWCREGRVPGARKVGRGWRLAPAALDSVVPAAAPTRPPAPRPGNARPRRSGRARLEPGNSGPRDVGASGGPGTEPRRFSTMKQPSRGPAADVVSLDRGDR